MDKVQINKTRMYAATDLSLDDNSALLADYDELVTAHQKLKTGISVIDENRQVQEADNTGLTKVKTEIREDLIRQILQFSGGLKAYATGAKNLDLKTKADYSYSELRNSPDKVLFDIGTLLMGLAIPLKTGLAKFSLGEDEFKKMESSLPAFKNAIPQKRVASTVSKVSTLNIGDEFNAIDKLLKDEIDSLMLPFQFTHPDFYNAYKNARIIVDYSGRGKTKPGNPLPPPAEN